jgi:hypothetical protein
MSESIEITTPVGRLVGGHPMVANAVTDQKTGQPKFQQDGVTPRTESYLGVAIPKGPEQHWNQTEWGAAIWNKAATDWPRGESGTPSFAWKITDGDSQIPNKRGRKPCEREGYPGHWVLQLSTGLPIKCYHAGKYEPIHQIQNLNDIKPGDYCRVLVSVRGNGPCESPGMYLNPHLFELSRAGVEIILDTGPSAADVFGGAAPQMPAGAQTAPAIPQQPTAAPAPTAPVQQTAVQPAPDFLNPPAAVAPAPVAMRLVNGQPYSEDALRAGGLNDAQIQALPTA